MEHLEYTFSPPLPPSQNPPPPPPSKNNLSMLYYGLVVVATATLVLAIYNLVIIKWCANHQRRLRNIQQTLEGSSLSRRRLNNTNNNNNPLGSSSRISLGESFKYKKGGEECKSLGYGNYECPVCLSVFEEEEEVRQLPSCRHSFHAPCIDMWLYTHLDCPLCRAPVELPVQTPVASTPTSTDHSREVLIGIP